MLFDWQAEIAETRTTHLTREERYQTRLEERQCLNKVG